MISTSLEPWPSNYGPGHTQKVSETHRPGPEGDILKSVGKPDGKEVFWECMTSLTLDVKSHKYFFRKCKVP